MAKAARILVPLIALVCLVLAAWFSIEILRNPIQTMRGPVYLAVFILLAISVNLGFYFTQSYLSRGMRRRLLGVVKWICTITIPFLIVSAIENHVLQRAVEQVKVELAPVVDYLKVNNNASTGEILNRLQKTSSVWQFSYYQREDGFVASSLVAGIDLEGYTIYFDSLAQQWHSFHNDKLQLYDRSPDKITNPNVIFYATASQKKAVTRLISFQKSKDSWQGQCHAGCL